MCRQNVVQVNSWMYRRTKVSWKCFHFSVRNVWKTEWFVFNIWVFMSIQTPQQAETTQHGQAFLWPVDTALNKRLIASYDKEVWTVPALNGPHGSLRFPPKLALRGIWSVSYKVHDAANRLGARHIGPAPKWARPDIGSAELHPSNL